MAVNDLHPEYLWNLGAWIRAREVLAGEDAVKSAGEKYLPRLEAQTDEEYDAYRARASFFNATARTADGYLGLVFRRPPFIKVPGRGTTKDTKDTKGEGGRASGETPDAARGTRALPRTRTGIERAMAEFVNDADMLGMSLASYARNVVREVIAVGRAGTLVDWESESENRVYASLYTAENILNWRVERVGGRNLLTMLALAERTEDSGQRTEDSGSAGASPYRNEGGEQIRVLRLVDGRSLRVDVEKQSLLTSAATGAREWRCVVEVWRPKMERRGRKDTKEWELVETRIPLRLGKPLPLIPFVFHGASHSLPDVDRLPLGDVIAVNLDHYRLHADYRHGMHFTALPTAWVSGFDKAATLRIGSSTAWVTDTPGASAGFLEYTGQGLTTFERAMDRDERLMAILGARLLETQKRVGETAEAIELRVNGENCILGTLAQCVSMSLTQVLRWAYWWNSTEAMPDDVSNEDVVIELNTDYSTRGLTANEIVAIVQAWQSGALSRDSMLDIFRRGEVLPEGRTNEEEVRLIAVGKPEPASQPNPSSGL